MNVIDDSEKINRPELIFGLVGPAGIRIDDLSSELTRSLEQFGYKNVDIRLSELLENFDATKPAENDEAARITHLQKKGDEFRRKLQDGGALARAAIAEIRRKRANQNPTGNPDEPASNCAYILRQLKHPDEVDLLREVYGSAFMLVGGHATRSKRTEELAQQFARSLNERVNDGHRADALKVIAADEKQADAFGQNTRDTYPKADFFANLTLDSDEHHSSGQFVELLFGHPFLTPFPDEYAMYQARAASLRSSDDHRQVGASIAKVEFGSREKNADVIAIGMNEVPRAGGGAYWQKDSADARDQAILRYTNVDRANDIKVSALAELIARMRDRGMIKDASTDADIAKCLLPHLNGTQFKDIGEFSRPVHAEMAALLDAARRGVSVDRKTMYVTTFPCHNCAKHIIASGITQVVYLEPYPKSRAFDLYCEEINLEATNREQKFEYDRRVAFFAYSGIAPRQYEQLFSISERGAKKGKTLRDWEASKPSLSPLYVSKNASFAYVRAEREALEKLPIEHYKWDKPAVCPKLK